MLRCTARDRVSVESKGGGARLLLCPRSSEIDGAGKDSNVGACVAGVVCRVERGFYPHGAPGTFSPTSPFLRGASQPI